MIQPRHLYADFELSRMETDMISSEFSIKSIRKVLSEDYWEGLPQNEKLEFQQMAKKINKIQARLIYVNKRVSYFTSDPKMNCSRRELARLKKCFSIEYRSLPADEKMHFIQICHDERKKVCPWYKSD